MKAYVICMNEEIRRVVLDDEDKAFEVLYRLKEEYYKDNKKWAFDSIEDYNIQCFWHTHVVDVEDV